MAELLWSGCRLALFGVILFGCGAYLYRKLCPAWQFTPLLTVSCVSLLIYAAGLLNFIPLMAGAIALFGLYQALYQVRETGKAKPSLSKAFAEPYRWFPVLLFAAFLVYVLYYTRGGRYPDGDTMTHWGVIVREMSETNRLPNFSSQEIAYQSYPPATACFLYFICAVVGYYESMAMTGQALLVLSCLLAPFALVKRKACGVQYAVLTLFAVYALQFNVALDDLKVDNLLPLTAFAAICIALYYWHEPQKAMRLNAPVLCFLILIKNSSPLYYLFVLALLACTLRGAQPKPVRAFLGYTAAAPLCTLFLWQCHIQMVYADAAGTRHSTSIASMLEIFSQRSQEDLNTIWNNYFTRWFHPVPEIMPNGSGEWPAVLVLTLLMVLALCVRKYRPRQVLTGYLGALTGYILYKFGLLGMYLFNLPDRDALYVGAYERYAASITILLYGLSALLAVKLLADGAFPSKRVRALWASGICVCMLLQPLLFPVAFSRYARPDYLSDGLYRRLCVLQRVYEIPEKDGHVLVFSHVPYAGFFVRFAFRSDYAQYVEPEELDKLLVEQKEQFEWLIVTDHDDKIDPVLIKYGLPLNQEAIRLIMYDDLSGKTSFAVDNALAQKEGA